VFDGSGLPITQAASTIAITRTHSTAAAIPATQTIAVKVRSASTGLRNILQPLIKKGTPLPAKGSQPLRAAYSIGPNLPGQIDLELFQDEGALEPDLNLAIGSFRISHHDLAEGMTIKEGDPVIFHWSMDDSGLLTVTAELPSLQQTFSSSRFYVDQEGHRSFEGEAGEKLVETAITVAETEAAEVVDAVGAGAKQQLDEIDRKLEEQRRRLNKSSSGDEAALHYGDCQAYTPRISSPEVSSRSPGPLSRAQTQRPHHPLQQICPARRADAEIREIRSTSCGGYE
jgi:molecular chaperone DnaK